MREEGAASGAGMAQRAFCLHNAVIPARPLEPAPYLVATPIGNLSDITLRALETLAGADVLYQEGHLVARCCSTRYGIVNWPYAYHEHNADEAGPRLIAALEAGKSVALVSDAGTPLVSDPWLLVRAARHRGRPPRRADPRRFRAACRARRFGPTERCLLLRRLPALQGQGAVDRLAELASVPASRCSSSSLPIASPRRSRLLPMCSVVPASLAFRELTKTFEVLLGVRRRACCTLW